MANQFSNALEHETSPYLRQHAHNPVAWYPWAEEALERALEDDKPILLSIGYSACHWCHVMAHESFEDPQIADLMNQLFVNIKVDREERPDLDKNYQLAHQMLTQRPGGWPLTLFLAPDTHVPFFAGTYFPKQPRYNMPAFSTVLQQGAQYYAEHKQLLQDHHTRFIDAMRSTSQHAPLQTPDKQLLAQARDELERAFDPLNGGFSNAPKFPHPTNIEFLLRHWYRSEGTDSKALHMTQKTLTKMAEGGIYDHLGGGFCRYSVDEHWLIPHFEKMLYDNGQLLTQYCQSWRIAYDPVFKNTGLETAEWTMREMQSPEGGYYSSLDADSEGEEGKFYIWERNEVANLLNDEEFDVVKKHYGVEGSPNFEGQWNLHISKSLAAVAQDLERPLSDTEQSLKSARLKLLQHRENRIRPGRDEKILTSWNALMVKAMAIAGRVFERTDVTASAQKSIDFLRTTLWTGTRLLATYKDDKAHLNAYLDDYAYSIDACLELLQTHWRTTDLLWAIQLADVLIQQFEDRSQGGFFFTSEDHESLIHRPKPMMDESTPAGNGIAALSLARLGHLIGNQNYVQAAHRAIEACSGSMRRYPQAHGCLMSALEERMDPPQVIIIRGHEMEVWKRSLNEGYRPDRLVFAITDPVSKLPGILAERSWSEENTIAYVCTGSECLAPFTDLSALKSAVNTKF